MTVEQRLRAAGDLVEVGQVELDDARRARTRETRRGLLALGRVAHRQHDVGAAFDETAGRFEADAAVGAGHDEGASGLLGQLPRMPGHAVSVRLGGGKGAVSGLAEAARRPLTHQEGRHVLIPLHPSLGPRRRSRRDFRRRRRAGASRADRAPDTRRSDRRRRRPVRAQADLPLRRPAAVHAAGKDGKTLVAYTKLARAKAFLRKQGITLPTPGKRVTPKAKSSASGHMDEFCTDRFEQGWCYQINSGWGLANVRALNGCNRGSAGSTTTTSSG